LGLSFILCLEALCHIDIAHEKTISGKLIKE
jgi:hypothetical protein